MRTPGLSLALLLAAIASTASTGCNSSPASFAATLATGETGMTSLATDDVFVYWTTVDGAVKRVAVEGGKVEILASSQHQPRAIALDSSSVYWATDGGVIVKAPKSGGNVVMLAAGPSILDMTVNANHVFLATNTDILRVAKEPGDMLTLATGQHPLAITADSVEVVWANSDPSSAGVTDKNPYLDPELFDPGNMAPDAKQNGVRAVAAAGGAVNGVPAQTAPIKVCVHAAKAFTATLDGKIWTSGLEVESASPALVADLSKLPLLNPSDKTPMFVSSIQANDDQVFVSTTKGTIARVSAAGGDTPETIVSGPAGRVKVVLGASNMVWANASDGSISVMPIPALP